MGRNGGPEGPGFWEIDAALFKRFLFGGSRYAEFRVDAFNVTELGPLGQPGHRLQHGDRQHVRPDHRTRRPDHAADDPLWRTSRVLTQHRRVSAAPKNKGRGTTPRPFGPWARHRASVR